MGRHIAFLMLLINNYFLVPLEVLNTKDLGNITNACFIILKFQVGDLTCNMHNFKHIINFSDDVSSKLLYIGWVFGDHHYDNSKVILDYD